MKHPLFSFLLLALTTLGTASCSSNGSTESADSQTDSIQKANDSTAIILTLMPVTDCLPLYYAQAHGLFAQQGLNVVIRTQTSLTDADTAIVNASTHFGFTDSARVACQTADSIMTPVLNTRGSMALVTCGKLRLRKADDLKLRTIASLRLSPSSRLCHELLSKAGIIKEDRLCPQIGDLKVRTAMLNENQIDAAVLPEPFVTEAHNAGHRIMPGTITATHSGRIVASRRATARKDYTRLCEALTQCYQAAADSINKQGAASVRDILTHTFHLNSATADSLRLPAYPSTTP